MIPRALQEHLDFLVQNINSPYENKLLLRSTLETSLRKLGHNHADISKALDAYYNEGRTVH